MTVDDSTATGDDVRAQARDAGLEVGRQVLEASRRAGLARVDDWGRFTLGGRDGRKFLQGLTTNDVVKLEDGAGCRTAFLNVNGRIECDAHAFLLGDELTIVTSPETSEWLTKSLGRFVRAGDFRFASLAETHAAVAAFGPRAPELLEEIFGVAVGAIPELGGVAVELPEGTARLVRVGRAGVWSIDVIVPVAAVERIESALVASGCVRLDAEALDVMRLEAGIPRYGRDFDADAVLQEIDDAGAVSFHKGCYLGQEIVARIHFQGQPSKLVRRLRLEGDGVRVAPGDAVVAGDEDRDVGRVTSVATSPTLGTIVLATVKRRAYAVDTRVRVRPAAAAPDAYVPAVVVARDATSAKGEIS